jgi:ubiquinone/menaquinone biosynthesis C-methylase UbiE
MSDVYDAGRALSPEALAVWSDAAFRHLVTPHGMILDLGSGTGRFSAPLADRLARPVVAVEPAAGMRDRAKAVIHPRVAIVAGRAEAIPARAGTCGLLWMSQAIHHVDDLSACARELRRVTVEGGRVLLRGMFDIRRHWVLGPYFPAAVRLGETLFPTVAAIEEAFAAASLRPLGTEVIEQTTVATAEELLARTRLRADSTLARIPDEEFRAGLAQLEADIRQGILGGPITERLDLLAFG